MRVADPTDARSSATRPLADDPALVHEEDAIRELGHERQLRARDHDRAALRRMDAQDVDERLALPLREVDERLVEEGERGAVGERLHEKEPVAAAVVVAGHGPAASASSRRSPISSATESAASARLRPAARAKNTALSRPESDSRCGPSVGA
jgi:hypothetical protein